MPAIPSPVPKLQFFTDAGLPAAGYKLYTYGADGLTPQDTFTDRAGTALNTNPIVLDARGECVIYLTPGVAYDYRLETPSGALEYTREDIVAGATDDPSVLHKTGGLAETADGNKTFTGAVHTIGHPDGGTLTVFDRPVSSTEGSQIQITAPGGFPGIVGFVGTTSRTDLRFMDGLFRVGVATDQENPTVFFEFSPTYLRPTLDNQVDLGAASRRWREVFAGTGTINTSDAREKTPVRPLTDAELAAAIELSRSIGAYQWLASVQEKGDAARLHIGLTVQKAIEVMQSHGLDPMRYGFICYDQWEANEQTGVEAGDRYSFRPDQLLLFIARGAEERLARLEGGGGLTGNQPK